MDIEISQEGKGTIEIHYHLPKDFHPHLISHTFPIAISGSHVKGLFQEFRGEGFSAWYNKYWTSAPAVLCARANLAVLELRIALKNRIKGSWECIEQPSLPAMYFQMGFVPYVFTKAIFDAPLEYETFDIHFDLSLLTKLGLDYKTLERFINLASRNKAAELSKFPHPCSRFMMDAVNAILFNSFSQKGKAILLRNNVINILVAALEEVGKEEIGKMVLSTEDIDALHHVRELIDQYCPEYPGNDVLITKARGALNAFKLSVGFKQLFHVNPYEYYLERRFLLARNLLRQGNKVSVVANELEYESATAFIKAFRKRFHYTPKQFQARGD